MEENLIPPQPASQENYNPASGVPAAKPVRYCPNHPTVVAEHRCRRCMARVCTTCAFIFPGNMVFCPTCATQKPEVFPSKRKGLLIAAYIMAAICTLSIAFIFTMALFLPNMDEIQLIAIANIIGVVGCFIPCLVGTGLSVATLDKKRGNPISVWGAVAWNGLLLTIWIILSVVGAIAG